MNDDDVLNLTYCSFCFFFICYNLFSKYSTTTMSSMFTLLFMGFLIYVLVMFLRAYSSSPNQVKKEVSDAKLMTMINTQALGDNSNSSNFAYSCWIYIQDWNYRYGEEKVVLARMKDATACDTACPCIALGAAENTLTVSLTCFSGQHHAPNINASLAGDNNTALHYNTVVHKCMLTNIPIQTWTQITVCVYGRAMDLYLDGKLVKTCLLPGVARVSNTDNVYLTPNGGFDGWTANIQYFANALNPQEVYNLYTGGYSDWSSWLSSYQLQFSLVKNGTAESTLTV